MRDEGATLRVGVAKSDITTDAPDARINDRLFAKALVLDDGRTRAAIVTMDVTAIGGRRISDHLLPDVGESFLPALRERIAAELHIPGEHVLVNASHTHPPGRMLCDDEQQIHLTFDAVRRAASSMVPVRVGAAIGEENRITINRNVKLKNGRHWTIRHTNPSPPSDEVVGRGPMDPQVGVLRIDRLDGTPLAVVYNFASHLLFGDPEGKITANFVGVTSSILEQTLGHDAMAFFVQGAAGDVIDVGFKDFSRARDINVLGRMLAESTLRAYQAIRPRGGVLRVASQVVELPRRTDIPQRIDALQQEQKSLLESLRFTSLNLEMFLALHGESSPSPGDDQPMKTFVQQHADKYLRNVRAMETLARIQDDIATLQKHERLNAESGETTVRAEISGIRIGDFVLITAPIEVLTEVALNIKRASPHPHTFIAGFTNGYLHYGPPWADYEKGGYEVTECLLAPGWQAIFEAAAQEILSRL